VAEWRDRDPLFATAVVDFGGIRRPVSMACVPEAETGDYVLVHAGIAISRVDAEEAAEIFEMLDEMDLAELEDGAPAEDVES